MFLFYIEQKTSTNIFALYKNNIKKLSHHERILTTQFDRWNMTVEIWMRIFVRKIHRKITITALGIRKKRKEKNSSLTVLSTTVYTITFKMTQLLAYTLLCWLNIHLPSMKQLFQGVVWVNFVKYFDKCSKLY